MTTKEFLENYNYSFCYPEEIAGIMVEIKDNVDLSGIAKDYLDAEDNFFIALDNIGFEFG